jgi:hypothetical protein
MIRNEIPQTTIERWKSLVEDGDLVILCAKLGVKSKATMIRYLSGKCKKGDAILINRFLNAREKKYKKVNELDLD